MQDFQIDGNPLIKLIVRTCINLIKIAQMKICPDCTINKDESEFIVGKRPCIRCKTCQNALRCKQSRDKKANAENITKMCKNCHSEKKGSEFEFGTLLCKCCFREQHKEANQRPLKTDPDKTCNKCQIIKSAIMFRKRELTCKECAKKMLYEWRENNKERFLDICKKYRDKDEKKKLRQDYLRKKYAEDIKAKLLQLYRTRVRLCIKSKYCPKKTAFDYTSLLGCKWETLIQWLEFNMKSGMTWDNYGPYWHVDHVYPCALFDFSDDVERKKCFNWTNLTPLEKLENIKKSDKLDIGLIQHYKKRAIEFIQQIPNNTILTDSLPDDMRLLIVSGALTTKNSLKDDFGSEEKSEV